GVRRAEALGIVEEVAGRDAGAPVDVLLDGAAVDQEGERLPHRRIGQQRMPGLHARSLAVDLGPGIGAVELDVLDGTAARIELDMAVSALLEPPQDAVLDLHLPRIVVLAGLQHRPRGRYGISAA